MDTTIMKDKFQGSTTIIKDDISDATVNAINNAVGGHVTDVEVRDNDEKIVKLDESGYEQITELMNDPSVYYLKEFIRITKNNRENVSDKFYNLILDLERTLTKYNAPWYVPYYQAVRNAILVLIYINSNEKLLSEDDYKLAIDAAGNVIEELIKGFKPEEDGAYNTFPVKYSVKSIFETVQSKLSKDAVDLNTEYEINLKKIEDRKSKIKYDTIRMFIVLNELQQKHKKYEKLYNILLLKAFPNKYRVKKPKANIKSEELLDAAGILVIEKQYPVEKFMEAYKDKIGNDIIKALEIDEKELENVHNNILVQRLSNEIPEIKELMDQMKESNENLKNLKNNELFNLISEAMNEIEDPDTDDKSDAAAEDLFNKINEKLPEDLKGRKKTETEKSE